VRVRITSPPTEASVDGVSLAQFKVGLVYAVPTILATLMIVEGWAEPVLDDIEPTLPAVRFTVLARRERRQRVYSAKYLRTHLGLAADRRRRK
jgi:uncharacterized protein (DUF2342 family)